MGGEVVLGLSTKKQKAKAGRLESRWVVRCTARSLKTKGIRDDRTVEKSR